MGASLNGSAQSGRRGRRRRHAPMSEINVTPFVDVMLVLLIIFMVAAPLMTSGVQIDLPSAKGKPIDAPKTDPLIVSVNKKGEVFLGEEKNNPMPIAELPAKLLALGKTRGGNVTEDTIFVRGDKSVEYGFVAQVMSQLKNAGFRKLSLVTQVEEGK